MTPQAMAALYARAFPKARAWSAGEIESLSAAPGFVVTDEKGFALGRAVAGEAELVTIAVDPAARRQGVGRILLAGFEAEAKLRGAERAFLEVAADNAAGLALYLGAGWSETGRRKGYYARTAGSIDAVTMAKGLG